MRRVLGAVPLPALLLAIVLSCWLLAGRLDIRVANHSTLYTMSVSLLLAIGLFASTSGIDRASANTHRRLIVSAVTVGVVVKAALIGGVLYLISRDPAYLVLAVAVAQIDPLSVAAILGDGRLSARVKTILSSWASFDDPMTVLLTVYASAVVFGPIGLTRGGGVLSGVAAYGVDLAANLAFAGVAFVFWRLARNRPALLAAVMLALAAAAVWQFLMLGVAIAGLFVRSPGLDKVMTVLSRWALLVAGAVLGLLLVGGVQLYGGLALGLLAFASQAVVGTLLTRGLPRLDRIHLALAQQNGITAIILALQLETRYDRAVATIAPAIVVTNAVHFVANRLVDRHTRTRNGPGAAEP